MFLRLSSQCGEVYPALWFGTIQGRDCRLVEHRKPQTNDHRCGASSEGKFNASADILEINSIFLPQPKLLLFLDEPTSGLDSQSAWAIMLFLRDLADNGQAILCT